MAAKRKKKTLTAGRTYYKQFNEDIRALVKEGVTDFTIKECNGQRYIATALEGELTFDIYGVPGQDLGAFMRGPRVRIHNNAQDGVGNTMDEGRVIIEGIAGDVIGYAMRGGGNIHQGRRRLPGGNPHESLPRPSAKNSGRRQGGRLPRRIYGRWNYFALGYVF